MKRNILDYDSMKLFKEAIENFNKYEPCVCGYYSKDKKTGICKICIENGK